MTTTEERLPVARRAALWRGVTRLPYTAGLVAVLLVVAIATSTAWTPLRQMPWVDAVAFGWPSLTAGRWWTVVTGSVFGMSPGELLVVLVLVIVGVGLCEWRFGTMRAVAVTWGVQVVGVVGGCALVGLLAMTGWPWAVATASELDAGFSAGGYGGLLAASATIRAPWRGRIRLAVLALVVVPLVHFGFLADVIHAVTLLIALPLGPLLAGRRPRLPVHAVSRREVRLMAAAFFVVGAVVNVVGHLVDRAGPFTHFGGEAADPWWWTALVVVLDLVIALGLVHGRRRWWRWAVGLTAASLLFVTLAIVLAFVVPEAELNYASILFAWVLDALQLGVLVFGRAAFRNPSRSALVRSPVGVIGRPPTESDRDAARAALERLGSANRIAWITTWSENSWWPSTAPDGFVAYQLHVGVAIGLCDPVAEPGQVGALADAFAAAAVDAAATPCFFSCTETVADWARERGWVTATVAQEAVIDLPGLEFKGKRWQDVRSAFNQAAKQGITHRLIRLADAPSSLHRQAVAISESWVSDKDLPEMGFTLGGIEEAEDPAVWVGVAEDADGRLHGLTSWLPVLAGGGRVVGWTLDVMRKAPECFRYTMEFLIASACVTFRDQGYEVVSLSGAPLAQAAGSAEEASVTDRVVNKLGALVEPYYGFTSLERFKQKFQPRNVPLYLVAPDEAALAQAGVAVGRAYLAHATPRQLLGLARP